MLRMRRSFAVRAEHAQVKKHSKLELRGFSVVDIPIMLLEVKIV